MATRPFQQIDVFASEKLKGNPVAVVLEADGLTDEQMAALANWTNLSETTFVLPPTTSAADYRLRIFTPGSELPFAGHPTLGSCHAWLTAGGIPQGDEIIQECGIGLVRLRRPPGGNLAFLAPPLRRSGPLEPELLVRIAQVLAIPPDRITTSQWVENGPCWAAIMLASREEALAIKPNFAAFGDLKVGVVAPYGPSRDASSPHFEVRAFAPSVGIAEDPVTGSLNAGLAVWLIGNGLAPPSYVASQGTALGRKGRVYLDQVGGEIWVGGATLSCVTGTLTI